MEKLLYKELSYSLIGAAMEVHKTLGTGFLEGTYQRAYEAELKIQKISFVAQKKIKIFYRNIDLGFQILDFALPGAFSRCLAPARGSGKTA